ncbi:MAG: hypothetical protein U0V56_12835 [Actinomycetota bacterium]
MRRPFPTGGMRYRFRLWRDRRRYPWHYAEFGSVKGSRVTSRILRWRLFVISYSPGDPNVVIVAECPDFIIARAVAGERFSIFTQREMQDTPKLRRALAAWDASMKQRRTHRAKSSRAWAPSPGTMGFETPAG